MKEKKYTYDDQDVRPDKKRTGVKTLWLVNKNQHNEFYFAGTLIEMVNCHPCFNYSNIEKIGSVDCGYN